MYIYIIYNIYTYIHYKIKYTHKHTHTYTHSHILPWNETRLKNRSKLYICNHDICLSSLLSNCFNNTVKINCTVQLQILETMQDFMTLMKMMLEKYLIHPQIVGKWESCFIFQAKLPSSTFFHHILWNFGFCFKCFHLKWPVCDASYSQKGKIAYINCAGSVSTEKSVVFKNTNG